MKLRVEKLMNFLFLLIIVYAFTFACNDKTPNDEEKKQKSQESIVETTSVCGKRIITTIFEYKESIVETSYVDMVITSDIIPNTIEPISLYGGSIVDTTIVGDQDSP